MAAWLRALPTRGIATRHAPAVWDLTKQLAEGVRRGDRTALSRSITLGAPNPQQPSSAPCPTPFPPPHTTAVESTLPEHMLQAEYLVAAALAGRATDKKLPVRVGVAGPPGAGKSTFIEALGCQLVKQGNKLAVLAIGGAGVGRGGGGIRV